MKIDITTREIELLLTFVHEAAALDDSFDTEPVFSMEEMALIEKLETAIKKAEILEHEILDTAAGSSLSH